MTRYTAILIILFFGNTLCGQNMTVLSDNELKIQHKINTVHHLEKINNRIFLLCDIRSANKKYLDILLIEIDEKGGILNEKVIGKKGQNEFPTGIHLNESNEYILLSNTVSFRNNKGRKHLDIYLLDSELNMISETPIFIPNLIDITSSAYNSVTENVIFTSIVQTSPNDFLPTIMQYNLKERAIKSEIGLNKKNWENKPFEIPMPDGKGGVKRVTFMDNSYTKSCESIHILNEEKNHFLLVGHETSEVTDFWVAKLEANKVVWEHQYVTSYGGDEGKVGFLTKAGNYLVFGHEYTKKLDTLYDYRVLLLDSKGEQLKSHKYYHKKGTKDWLKSAIQLNEKEYIIFGQVEELMKPIKSLTHIETSNLWFIAVDERGNKIDEFLYESQGLDEALFFIKLDDNHVMAFYNNKEGEKEIMRSMVLEIKRP